MGETTVDEAPAQPVDRVYPKPRALWSGAQPWVREHIDDGVAATFLRGRRGEDYADERGDTPARRRVVARLEREAEVLKILGAPVFKDVTCLTGRAGEWVGEFRWGRKVRPWGLWAPHHRLAIDFFARAASVPSAEELEAKRAFAEERGVRYYVVLPGYVFGNDDLRALVEGGADGGLAVTSAPPAGGEEEG